MLEKTLSPMTWLCILIVAFASCPVWPQKPPSHRMPIPLQPASCCEEVKELEAQIANQSDLLSELMKDRDWPSFTMQVTGPEGSNRHISLWLTNEDTKFPEMNNEIDITQAAQTSADAIYDCSSLYQKNYRISGLYKLPPNDFLGRPKAEVFCDMETSGGGWTVIQRRKNGLVSFYQDWKQYKKGFGNIHGDFWLGNEHIHRLTRRPTQLRVEMEDWEGNVRYAEYSHFALGNEVSSYRLFLGNYSGNVEDDALFHHNDTAFTTKDKDNDSCLENCAKLLKGGYWYKCCATSNLNGVYYNPEEQYKHLNGLTWIGWHGTTYSLKRVEMKIRPEDFRP
ncbi:angiopoietin-related protein 7-like [Choloepus didactylus]|uniref:angiopoietin-related protein 7-like n=1 Tax=Choloepus didactylus TaxID=27675 RepID=UPI00189EDC88|nr:angiopoietin-related protein 7-like [Choloepus didactylus]